MVRDYIGGVLGITYMALVHAPLVLVPFLPVALGLVLLSWGVERTRWRAPAAPLPPAGIWLPTLATLAMLLFAPPFFQPQTGGRRGPLPWPAWVIGGLLLLHLGLAVATWWVTEPARRPTGRLLLQLWLALSAALVTATSVTPGGALGAL